MGTPTANKGYTVPTLGGDFDTWGNEINADLGILDLNLGGGQTIDVSGNSNVTATTSQAQHLITALSGALTGDIQYILPAVGGLYIIINQTTGAHTLSVACAGGGIATVVPQGTSMTIYTDGTSAVSATTSYAKQGDGVSFASLAVSGATSFAGGVTTTGNDSGGFNIRIRSANYGVGWQNNDTDTYLLLTNSGNASGSFNGLRPFVVHNATGALTIDGTGAGTTFGGGIAAQTAVGVTFSGQGGAGLIVGSGGNPGFLSITNSSGTQVGLAGFTDGSGHLELQALNGYTGWRCTGTFTVDGLTSFVGGNGNPIGTQTSGWSFVTGGAAAGYAASGAPLALGNGVLGGNILNLFFGNSQTGSIANNGAGTGVVYNTTSDGRLKIKRGRITESGSIIDRIAALWFNWKAAPDAESEPGFFAQQLYRFCPWAVTKGKGRPGRKDFVPWQVDKSALIPVIIAELQDVRRRLAAQEARR